MCFGADEQTFVASLWAGRATRASLPSQTPGSTDLDHVRSRAHGPVPRSATFCTTEPQVQRWRVRA
jgi:hypothetical protein